MGSNDALVVVDQAVEARLWFGDQDIGRANKEDLSRCVNVLAHSVNAEVIVRNVDEDLAQHIRGKDFKQITHNEPLEAAYTQLAKKVLAVVLRSYNRLAIYARSNKGQYWINEYTTDSGRTPSYLAHFRAQVENWDDTWNRFSSGTNSIAVELVSEERYITASEWAKVQAFVRSATRDSLVGNLLAGAEELAGKGHTRSALTEAITALEVALYRFSRKPRNTFGQNLGRRLGVASLASQVEHMGLTGSVSYLLPTILPEEILPTDLVENVRQAIAQRTNVVHEGQREVDNSSLWNALRSVRCLCDILFKLTSEE